MKGRHPLGTIAHLWRYPVKSLAAEPLERTRVEAGGLEGDRREALFVATPDHARSGRTYRGKEHNLLHTVREASRAADLAAERDLEIDVRGDGPHFDAGAVSILTDTWLADLETLLAARLDPLRFRPNLFVRADPSFALREEALTGAKLYGGEVEFEVVATIKRCVTTTYDIETGVADPRVLRAIAEHRGNVMGVYCDVRRTGVIETGETFWIDLP
jgi:hypothetical protein